MACRAWSTDAIHALACTDDIGEAEPKEIRRGTRPMRVSPGPTDDHLPLLKVVAMAGQLRPGGGIGSPHLGAPAGALLR